MWDIELENQKVKFGSSNQMKELQDNSIDIIVTSPPYKMNKTYVNIKTGEVYDDKRIVSDNDDYYLELNKIFRECYRVASDKCVFFLNLCDPASNQGQSEKIAENVRRYTDWERVQTLVWVKSIHGRGHFTPSGKNKRFANVWEYIFIFVKNKKKYALDTKSVGIPYADKSNIGRYSDIDRRDGGNIWHIPYEKTSGQTTKKFRDSMFPIELPYRCIKAVPNTKTVLDPFLGSGSSLSASLSLGKIGFGYEKHPQEDIIIERILEGKDFKPIQPILIPHYEVAIKFLYNELKKGWKDYKLHEPETKIGKIRYDILQDILKKMGL